MNLFHFSKKKKQPPASHHTCKKSALEKTGENHADLKRHAFALPHYRILVDSIDLIEKTVYPQTFFSRYETALQEAETIIPIYDGHPAQQEIRNIFEELQNSKVEIFNDFFDRCYRADKLHFVKEEIIAHRTAIPEESYRYLTSLLNAHTAGDDDDEYIFCSVVFGNGGKAYYYLSDEDNITCDDEVIVPVGKDEREKTGHVVKIERIKGNEAPVPAYSLKHIIRVNRN